MLHIAALHLHVAAHCAHECGSYEWLAAAAAWFQPRAGDSGGGDADACERLRCMAGGVGREKRFRNNEQHRGRAVCVWDRREQSGTKLRQNGLQRKRSETEFKS